MLYGWTSPWFPADWKGGSYHSAPFVARNVRRAGSDLELLFNPEGEAQIQSGLSRDGGIYETDLTLGPTRDGVMQSFFLYAKTGEEIDFEVVGRTGVQLAVHRDGREVNFRPEGYQGDLSGRRIRVGFTHKAGQFVSFFLDGKEVWRVTAAEGPGGRVPSGPLNAAYEVWGYPSGAAWAGPFHPLAPGEAITLTLHGYQVSQF